MAIAPRSVTLNLARLTAGSLGILLCLGATAATAWSGLPWGMHLGPIFGLPVGAVVIGIIYGMILYFTFRIFQVMPQVRDKIVVGILCIPMALAGDALYWMTPQKRADQLKGQLSDHLTFPKFLAVKYWLSDDRSLAPLTRNSPLPGQAYAVFGLLLTGVAASATVHAKASDAFYCERCRRYYRRITLGTISGSKEAVYGHLATTMPANSGTLTSDRIVAALAGPRNSVSGFGGFTVTFVGFSCPSCCSRSLRIEIVQNVRSREGRTDHLISNSHQGCQADVDFQACRKEARRRC